MVWYYSDPKADGLKCNGVQKLWDGWNNKQLRETTLNAWCYVMTYRCKRWFQTLMFWKQDLPKSLAADWPEDLNLDIFGLPIDDWCLRWRVFTFSLRSSDYTLKDWCRTSPLDLAVRWCGAVRRVWLQPSSVYWRKIIVLWCWRLRPSMRSCRRWFLNWSMWWNIWNVPLIFH